MPKFIHWNLYIPKLYCVSRSLLLLLIFLQFSTLHTHAARAQSTQVDSLEYKLGQLFIVGFRGTTISEHSPIVRNITKNHIGGVILFDYDVLTKKPGRNISSLHQLQTLSSALNSFSKNKLLIAIDEEGGKVNRLKPKYGFPKTPSAQSLGKLKTTDSTKYYANQTADLLSKIGINLNFAPVCDLNVNPENPVIGKIERSYHSSADTVFMHAKCVVNAHRKKNILTALKHFPGHGSSQNDSHFGFVDVSKTWSEEEYKPFQKLISEDLADIVMTAHIYNQVWDSVPATLSRQVITSVLREQFNFDGVVCSDDMQMKAITDHYGQEVSFIIAMNAGVDMFIIGNNVDYDEELVEKSIQILKKAILQGKISLQRLNDAYRRVNILKASLK